MLPRLALRTNIAALAPWVLPLGEMIKCAMDKTYVPNFKLAFEHFLIHTGGRAVIEVRAAYAACKTSWSDCGMHLCLCSMADCCRAKPHVTQPCFRGL